MQEDNILKNDSTFFFASEPEEQKSERNSEKANTLAGLKVLKDVIARLEERIEFYSSVDSIPKDAKLNKEKFMTMHNANEITRDNLREEKEYIESLMDANS